MSFVRIENLSKILSGRCILNNINLEIEKKTINGFIGHNGSGKTMLFRAICNFISPSTGKIYVNDILLNKNSEYPVNVGVIIEYPGFIDEYSGYENLRYLYSIRNKIDNDKLEEIMKLVGIYEHRNTKVKKYSLGMRQRLGLAQAIMEEPELLILDEPINALDSDGIDMFKKIIIELRDKGCTILIATHTKEILLDLFDSVYVMSDGRIVKNEKESKID